jgi:hypothetical protein
MKCYSYNLYNEQFMCWYNLCNCTIFMLVQFMYRYNLCTSSIYVLVQFM